ncbi:hypothetical protein FH972_021852 [Carpinus fangiana]|uniref:Uncharacterized protein n=1 Tax=Carpinus fangiana TaxID=176857 RepID=A0A5N6KQW0_9ROSI|nr:hypothetical protein FH972_021852 [Carpinus fangiana]
MGRELQKRKNRSSVSKVRQKPKSKKKIFNNPIIAANWDQKQTLSQNYRRLGLATKLNAPSGGIERNLADIKAAQQAGEEHAQGDTTKRKGSVKDARTEAERTNHDRALTITLRMVLSGARPWKLTMLCYDNWKTAWRSCRSCPSRSENSQIERLNG